MYFVKYFFLILISFLSKAFDYFSLKIIYLLKNIFHQYVCFYFFCRDLMAPYIHIDM